MTPSWLATRWKTYGGLLVLLGAVALLRLLILFSSQSHVDGDEGVVGVMARHVLYAGARPIFYYGQPYGGGAAIEAYLAALSFWIFGASVSSFKAVAFLLSFAALPLCHALCLRHFDRRVALLAVALLAFASPWIEWNTKVRGGYAALLLLGTVIWYLWAAVAYEGRKQRWIPFGLGVVSGLAYYNQELLVPLIGVLVVVALVWQRDRWTRTATRLGGARRAARREPGHLLQPGARLRESAPHARIDSARRLSGAPVGAADRVSARLLRSAERRQPAGDDSAPSGRRIRRLRFPAVLPERPCLALARFGRAERAGPALEQVMLLFVGAHLLAYLFSRGAGVSARYLLPLFPPLAILAAIAICRLLSAARAAPRVLGAAAGLLLLGIGVANAVSYIGPSRVRILVWTQEQGFENRDSSGEAIAEIVALLEARGVRFVRSSHFVQWRLVFESNERIIASSAAHLPGGSVYPDYDRRVAAAEARGEPVGYVFHESSLHWQKPGGYSQSGDTRVLVDMPRWLEAQGLERIVVEDFVLYAPTRAAGR